MANDVTINEINQKLDRILYGNGREGLAIRLTRTEDAIKHLQETTQALGEKIDTLLCTQPKQKLFGKYSADQVYLIVITLLALAILTIVLGPGLTSRLIP